MILSIGCGTTRISDTMRTGTEQLLLSNAVDRAINEMNLSVLNGKDVYLDTQYLRGVVDEGYIVSSLRQHLLASGCVMKRTREEATYVVEARAGAVGTDRHDVLLGVPAVSLPSTGMPGVPSQIPEIPFAKSTQQKGVAKLAVFVYDQVTGTPTWQSGSITVAASSRDTWLLGTGPFERGTIYQGTGFAGSRLLLPFSRDRAPKPKHIPDIPVTAQATFNTSTQFAQRKSLPLPKSSDTAESGKVPSTGEALFTPMGQPNNSAVVQASGTSIATSSGSFMPSGSGTPNGAASQPTPQSPGTANSSGGNGAGVLIMGAAPWIHENTPLTLPGYKRYARSICVCVALACLFADRKHVG